MTREVRYPDRECQAKELAASVAASLANAIDQRGRASLVVSGGTTPADFLEQLRAQSVPWSKVTVTLTDERWVPAGHPRSNEAMVREKLLRGTAAAAELVGLTTDHDRPEEAEETLSRRIAEIVRPFDVVVLGMGTDGHFASLFPDSPAVENGLEAPPETLCVAVHPAGQEPRISLTLPAIQGAIRVILLIAGSEKWRVWEEARERSRRRLPIDWLLRDTPALEAHWAP